MISLCRQLCRSAPLLLVLLLAMGGLQPLLAAQQPQGEGAMGVSQAVTRTQAALERANLAMDQARQDLEQRQQAGQATAAMERRAGRAEFALDRIMAIRDQLKDLSAAAAAATAEQETVCFICVAQAGAVTAMHYSSAVRQLAQSVSQQAGGQAESAEQTAASAAEAMSMADRARETYRASMASLQEKSYQAGISLAKRLAPQCEQSPEEIVAGGPGAGPPEGVPAAGPPENLPAVPDFAPADPPAQPGTSE
jgi:hypothetical protein